MNRVFQLGSNITLLPVIHGSGDFAVEVRRIMLGHSFDALAVPLPESFQADVEEALLHLPTPTVVVQQPTADDFPVWDSGKQRSRTRTVSFVPVDPCQPVITAIRLAMGERIPRVYIDRESQTYRPHAAVTPDPFALKQVRLDRFAAAILPAVVPPPRADDRDRVIHMAHRLRELEPHYRRILCLCSITDWPWIRAAYSRRARPVGEDTAMAPTEILEVDPATLVFMLGELPFVTALYERARAELEDDEHLSIDGVKELLIAARKSYRADFGRQALRVTPQALSICLRYMRNLALLDRRMTPDLYNIVMAAKQVISDGYALHVADRARDYPHTAETPYRKVGFGIQRMRLPDGEIVRHANRLPGAPLVWRTCQLTPKPLPRDRRRWQMSWNPYSQCSWPPEDKRIEDFRTHVADRAKALMGMDLAKTEKFTTSLKDGLDIRDTLRNWHTGDLYVKVLPPSQGRLDAVAMLFDSPADPRSYPWRTTWFAEHQNESTLAFFATDFVQQMVGPGIGQAVYGGALFLFPPMPIPDIWNDRRLDFTETLEERLLAACCLHSQSAQVALLAPAPPGPGWRRLAKRFGKKWVHIPLSSFSQQTVAQLRIVHVLNGHDVRSYASHFIRKA